MINIDYSTYFQSHQKKMAILLYSVSVQMQHVGRHGDYLFLKHLIVFVDVFV